MSSDLESLISHAICLDIRLCDCQRNRASFPGDPEGPFLLWQQPTLSTEDPEPMQIGHTRLSQIKRIGTEERNAASTVARPATSEIPVQSSWEKTSPVQQREGCDGRYFLS